MKLSRQTVLFISGFLTPTNWVSYPPSLVPENVDLITIYPSSVASLHDRACQIFYELKGTLVAILHTGLYYLHNPNIQCIIPLNGCIQVVEWTMGRSTVDSTAMIDTVSCIRSDC